MRVIETIKEDLCVTCKHAIDINGLAEIWAYCDLGKEDLLKNQIVTSCSDYEEDK